MLTHGKKNQNIEKLQNAIDEAQRFVRAAIIARDRLIENDSSEYTQYSFKEVAAAKRAALDCGRAMTMVNQMKSY